MRRLAAAVLLVAALTSCGAAQGDDDSSAGEVRSLAFQSETVGGTTFEGSSLEGEPAVIWFWAPWCSTCRAQIDGVSSLAAKLEGKVSFVGVGSLDDAAAIDGFAAAVPGDDITQLTDPQGEVWRHFGVTAQSTYLVLDDDGREVAAGSLSDDELAELVTDLAG